MKDFIKIQEIRIRKGNIKKYSPQGETKLNIYFSTSRDKVEYLPFIFDYIEERDEVLDLLDNIFVL